MTEVVGDAVNAGREAVGRRAWHEAYELLSSANAGGELETQDLELLGEVAYWTGRAEEQMELYEQVYRRYVDAGNRRRAAYIATRLAHEYGNFLQPAVASGWLGRAGRLLEEAPESPEYGYWLLERSLRAGAANDFEEVLRLATEAEELGRRLGDRNVEVRGLQRRGAALIALGDVTEGTMLLDEASAAAAAGELTPHSTMVVYCNTIGACRNVGDFDRAGEWTERAQAFCLDGGIEAFPGLCRVNYAELMKYKGRLEEARDEAGRAGEDLRVWCPRVAGAAFYELGEIRLLLGELELAEHAFREADENGTDPEPGLSLLRLARGNARGAWSSIARALADDGVGQLARTRLLPAAVEIAVAAGELERAGDFAGELAEAATRYGTSPLKASAAFARGSVKVAQGNPEGAFGDFREARRLWDATGANYDVARARERLGLVARAGGDEEAALWELQAAAARFERFGATRDAERVGELLRRADPETVLKTFLFTDIVRSTDLLATIGDRHWANALRRHDEALRAIVKDYAGHVVDHTGDGFFVAFDDAAAAVHAAIAVQRTVDQEFVFDVRIGVHTDGALRSVDGYRGQGVHTAARVGAAAEGREVLATEVSIGNLPQFKTTRHRQIALKGLKEPVAVCSVEWR